MWLSVESWLETREDDFPFSSVGLLSEHWYLYGRSAIFSLVPTCPFGGSEGRKEGREGVGEQCVKVSMC